MSFSFEYVYNLQRKLNCKSGIWIIISNLIVKNLNVFF